MTYNAVRDKTRFCISDDSGWAGSMVFSLGENGIEIAADQEHAVDSYNHTFSNTYTIPSDIAEALGVWLLRMSDKVE